MFQVHQLLLHIIVQLHLRKAKGERREAKKRKSTNKVYFKKFMFYICRLIIIPFVSIFLHKKLLLNISHLFTRSLFNLFLQNKVSKN